MMILFFCYIEAVLFFVTNTNSHVFCLVTCTVSILFYTLGLCDWVGGSPVAVWVFLWLVGLFQIVSCPF